MSSLAQPVVQSVDWVVIAPPTIAAVVGLLVLVADLFVDDTRKALLGWVSALFLVAPEAVALGYRPHLSAAVGGVLLAVCSKNNQADVVEVFESRPEIPLRLTDFAATEIGWGPKHEGLRKIAAALNIIAAVMALVVLKPMRQRAMAQG